jgi:RimJ/RimL family protein N-acetyltransferase
MNPILLEFPDSFETKRLLIRSPLPGDGRIVRQAALESQPELKEWLPWAVELPDEDAYEALVRQGRLKFLAREDLWLLLFHKESNTCIGGSGLHRINWDVPRMEIGYWLHTAYTGQGLMTEAVLGITEFAFTTLGAQRVEIRCDQNNTASAAVAQRAGYTLEGVLLAHDRHHATKQLRNTMIFARTNGMERPE